jgi:glutamate formiminotransferase
MLPTVIGASDATLECVPNFSEGRRAEVVRQIVSAAESFAAVLDVHSDVDHNRSVLTLAGKRTELIDSVLAATEEAVRSVDLKVHAGVHPRIGAVDVVPFVPLSESTMEDGRGAAKECGKSIYDEFGIPVFFYGAASDENRELPELRRGAFKSLAPDVGVAPHPTAGAVAVGARELLVAYNVNLKTTLEAAASIAAALRERDGGLPHIRALAFRLESRGLSQVSTNLVRPGITTIPDVYDRVAALCRAADVEIAGAELVGLAPRAALKGRDPESFGLDSHPKILEEELERLAI